MPEYIFMKAPCGFCMTQHHHNCKPTLDWNSKVYVCGCPSCDVKSTLDISLGKESEDIKEDIED